MSDLGRKEYKSWPSRRPLWRIGAFIVAVLSFVGILGGRYTQQWSFAEREYLKDYMLASTLGRLWDENYYTLLVLVDRQGRQRIASGNEIESGKMADGRTGYRLTEEGVQAGAARVEILRRKFKNAWMQDTLGSVVYQEGVWAYLQWPTYGALGIFIVLLFVAVPKDRKRALVFKYGRRLRGPELVTTAEFNRKLGRRKWLMSDGLALINEIQSWMERKFDKEVSRWVRIPREREAMHLLFVGDTGHGKSATVRQALSQIWERGETAIVYDPKMEYLPQFYNPGRGDVILNPLDERCPSFLSSLNSLVHRSVGTMLSCPAVMHRRKSFHRAFNRTLAHDDLRQLVSQVSIERQ
ncbi:MAG TPA: type IV secretion system DNA-binding domain-containing protein [Granulicella sp.]|nr:type IV secretion system DNA-binding domain-containing protein [Granulicella sp.]